jgi:hypothetical protein
MANSTSILATISTQGLAGNIIIANSTSVHAGNVILGAAGNIIIDGGMIIANITSVVSGTLFMDLPATLTLLTTQYCRQEYHCLPVSLMLVLLATVSHYLPVTLLMVMPATLPLLAGNIVNGIAGNMTLGTCRQHCAY